MASEYITEQSNSITSSSSAIETRTLSDQVYEYLTDCIIKGEIAYGQKLNIKELANVLNVSTMPVRDAVRRLEIEGVVEVKPRSNCVVRVPTRRLMLDAFEMRVVLETYAVEKVYPRVTPQELGNLGRFLQNMEDQMPIGGSRERMAEFVKNDQLFHQELCALAGNVYLLQMYRSNALHLNIALTFSAGVEPNMDQVEDDHRELFELLKKNSPESVSVVRRHLSQCRTNMVRGEFFNSLERE